MKTLTGPGRVLDRTCYRCMVHRGGDLPSVHCRVGRGWSTHRLDWAGSQNYNFLWLGWVGLGWVKLRHMNFFVQTVDKKSYFYRHIADYFPSTFNHKPCLRHKALVNVLFSFEMCLLLNSFFFLIAECRWSVGLGQIITSVGWVQKFGLVRCQKSDRRSTLEHCRLCSGPPVKQRTFGSQAPPTIAKIASMRFAQPITAWVVRDGKGKG